MKYATAFLAALTGLPSLHSVILTPGMVVLHGGFEDNHLVILSTVRADGTVRAGWRTLTGLECGHVYATACKVAPDQSIGKAVLAQYRNTLYNARKG